jgi:exopolysaccharide biosynthesis polyprenyl glycosylphosphotransferase
MAADAMAIESGALRNGTVIPRQSFKPVGAVRTTASQAARVFDAVCALTVMLVIFTMLNIGRMPGGLQEFLAMRLSIKNFAVAIVFVAIWHTTFASLGLYQAWLIRSFRAAAVRIALACTIASLCFVPFMAASHTGTFGMQVVLLFWVAAVAVELLGRAWIATGVHYAERAARDIQLVLIVGSGPRAVALWRSLRSRGANDYELAGFIDTRELAGVSPEISPLLIGTLDDLEGVLTREPIDQVLIALPVKSCYSEIQTAIEVCERVGVEASYYPDIFPVARARRELDQEDEMPVVRLHQVAGDHRLIVKRIIDIVGAAAGLVALSPVLLLCAIAIRLTSPGPVVFSQVRYGFNRRRFRMYKFRTMVQNAERLQADLESRNEAQGPVFKIKADPRITKVGGFLRRTSLDELPQLFNVLTGDMSLVGPRPLAVRDVARFDAGWLMRRFSVKPGLTCLWQVNGRSDTDFERWVQLDLHYIDNWSLALDMRILIKTVPAVFSGTGAM